MAKWYWKEWRTHDHVEKYARLWHSHGLLCWVSSNLFWASSLLIVIACKGSTKDPEVFGIAGMGAGVGAYLAAAGFVFALASSVQDKLRALNERIDELSKGQGK